MRVIRTEKNYFYNQGELLAYKEAGIAKYEYLATLDSRTSTVCQDVDAKRRAINPDTGESNLYLKI